MSRRRILTLLIPLLLSALFFANFYRHVTVDIASRGAPVTASRGAPVTASLFNHPTHLAQHLSIETLPLSSPAVTESVLFPDWDVFVLLPPSLNLSPGDRTHLSCLFSNGATSAANYTNKIPSSDRHGFICKMPRSVQRHRPFYTPRIIGSGSGSGSGSIVIGSDRTTKMMKWIELAYESYSTADDVIVFAKGVNKNQGKDRPAGDVVCYFFVNGAVASVTAATISAQEVFRCPHPESMNYSSDDDVRVSVKISGERSPIPSLAAYRPPPPQESEKNQKALTCACTMVYNAAKFLREWVSYHAAVGVERFVLYDNGSDDSLAAAVARLAGEGYDVSSVYWPWQKTQEAGFSHCAAAQASGCTWMAFFDVDEFLYSPSWAEAARPNKSMVGSVIGPDTGPVGQVQITCADFGPSGQLAHPQAGVTQGYTCRLKNDGNLQRHKSIVRLEAVGSSLKNSVHHFDVDPAWVTRRLKGAVVNHYKYQAWSEFRLKFRRRVSAYVADWRERRNVGSRDRTPGLGFSGEEEPEWWARGSCDGRDEGLREVVRRWFGGPQGRLPWE